MKATHLAPNLEKLWANRVLAPAGYILVPFGLNVQQVETQIKCCRLDRLHEQINQEDGIKSNTESVCFCNIQAANCLVSISNYTELQLIF